MESRHSGTQTRNGKNWKIGIGCILTSTSFRVGWRVHLASDLLVIFSHSPVRPRSFPVLLFPFWVPNFPMIFHFFGKCFREFVLFPGWRPLRAEVKSPPSRNGKEMGNNSKLRMLVQGGPFFEPVVPDALALAVFGLFSFDFFLLLFAC